MNFGLPYEGCTNRDTVEITQIDEIVVNAYVNDVNCFGQNNGSISTTPPNGYIVGGTGTTNNVTIWWCC